MTAPWLYAGTPDGRGDATTVLTEGTTFCIGDTQGEIGTRSATGLFVRDTRVLSSWQLSLEQRQLQPLRVQQDAPYCATFVLFSPGETSTGRTELVVSRDRYVGDGMREDIAIRNPSGTATNVQVHLEVGADFADLFEVKDGRTLLVDDIHVTADPAALRITRTRSGSEFAVTVEAAPDTLVDADGLHWSIDLDGHAVWCTTVQVIPLIHGQELTPHHHPDTPVEHAGPAQRHRFFRSNAPRLTTADPVLAEALARSIDDLASLRIFDPERPDLAVVAAGAPWFMALFGRDSLLTATMLLSVDSSLAVGTLTTLSAHLGTSVNPLTEEQPGRVPHELRFGPAGPLALGGRNAYYGSADATPLFVVALGELMRWQPALVNAELVSAADRALDWMQTFGDPDGDGFIEYERATPHGLVNQGWKDSWDGINFAEGSMAEAPIALAEVQAYAYAAYLARARIADARGETARSVDARDRAARLKERFNEAFWLPDRGWYAVGLDRDKSPIDALTSNNGHCLWAGIADEDKAEQVAAHLMSPEMFTGWGIRTLGTQMGAYNPMSYHNGSVWPHDTAICVAGLMAYGHVAAAQQVALAVLDASAAFGGRLPELFAGFDRTDFAVPIPYPAACTPQAWAAAAPIEVLRVLLGLEPTLDGLECRPHLPDRLLPLLLLGVGAGGVQYDVAVDAHGCTVHAAR